MGPATTNSRDDNPQVIRNGIHPRNRHRISQVASGSEAGSQNQGRGFQDQQGVTNPSVAAPALTPTTPSRGLPFRDSSSSRYVHHVHALPGRALYRPPGIPVLVGSYGSERTQPSFPRWRRGPRRGRMLYKCSLCVKGPGTTNSPHTYYGRGAILYWRQLSMWRASEPGGRPCQG